MKKVTMILLCLTLMLVMGSCSQKDNAANVNPASGQPESTPLKAVEPTASPAATPVETPTPKASADASKTKEETKKLVALTFDDGPNLDTTPLVLDKLEEHGVVASFFLIGKYIDKYTKPVMERQLALGCEINNHSWNHNAMDKLTPEQIKEEIQKTNDLIKEMTGTEPKFFRPPFIVTNNAMYDAIDLPFINGINCTDWDAGVVARNRAQTILSKVQDGDIILLHDFSGNKNTVEALDDIIQGLLDDGYALVTVSQLFEAKGIDPKVENKIWSNTAW